MPGPSREGSRLRKLIIGAVVVVVGMVALEGALRLLDAFSTPSVPPSPVAFQQGDPAPVPPGEPKYVPCGGDEARSCLKTAAGLRVLVFGGSAAAGTPFSHFEAFSGWIQRYLVRLAGGRPVEVINTALIGRSSTQVLSAVRNQVQNLKPDLIIIYSGNNEYYSLRARKMLLPLYSPKLELVRHRLWALRTYRLLSWVRGLFGRPTDDTVGIDTRTVGIPVTPADHKLAAIIYRDNLSKMASAARGLGARVLLATVGTNLLSSPNIAKEVEGSMERVEPFVEALRQGADRTRLQAVARRNGLDLDSHSGQFIVGVALHRLGRPAEALHYLHRAELLDYRTQRCTEPLRRALLAEGRAEGVPTCDTARALASAARGGVPGKELFEDACHPSRLGHRVIARALLRCILGQGLLPLKPPPEGAIARAIADAEQSADDIYRLDNGLLSDPNGERRGAPARPGDPRWQAARGMELFRDFTVNTGGDSHRIHDALAHMEQAQAAGAPAGPMTLNRALILLQLGEEERALALLREAVKLMPGDLDVRNYALIMGIDNLPAPEGTP